MNALGLLWDGTLLECLQLSQLTLGTLVPLGDPYPPAAASASACCGTANPLLGFSPLAVGQRTHYPEEVYTLEQLPIMTWDTHCIVRMSSGGPVDFIISPFGGKSPQTRGGGGRGNCTASHPLGVKFTLLLSNYLNYQLLGTGWVGDWDPSGSSFCTNWLRANKVS